MIIKNGEVFQEDGSFRLQDLYVENHRIVPCTFRLILFITDLAVCFRQKLPMT